MATVRRFEELECWQSGRKLKQTIYGFTRRRPFASDFALVSQIRRAAQSVTSNIAEGFERGGNRELIQFLSQSKGSAGEIKDQLYTALDECYVSQKEFALAYDLAEQTTRLIGGFMSYLRRSDKVGPKFVSQSRPDPEL
jgi:four helix bundle protein